MRSSAQRLKANSEGRSSGIGGGLRQRGGSAAPGDCRKSGTRATSLLSRVRPGRSGSGPWERGGGVATILLRGDRGGEARREVMNRLTVLCFAGTYALALACDLARPAVRA